jgi:two-component system, cell cycle response regulator DivK
MMPPSRQHASGKLIEYALNMAARLSNQDTRVEDNHIHANLIKDVLEIKGFATVRAENGIEAQKLARDRRPDLVIMDIQIPEVSGIEVTKAIKADPDLKDIPIIAVTAFASEKDEQNIRRAGASDIITKPFSVPNLLETIIKYLGDPAKPSS